MFSSGPSGFLHAPFTKVTLITTSALSVLFSLLKTTHQYKLGGLLEFTSGEIYRPFTAPLFFASSPELLFGVILIYYFRIFERQMGTRKFSSFAVIVTTISSLLEIGLWSTGFDSISPGPYPLIFGSLVQFYCDIPKMFKFKICGIPASDKSFIYALSLQLLLNNGSSSLITGLIGIISGIIYRSDAVPLTEIRIPRFISNFCTRYILPLLGTSPSRRPPALLPVPANNNSNTHLQNPHRFQNPLGNLQNPNFVQPNDQYLQQQFEQILRNQFAQTNQTNLNQTNLNQTNLNQTNNLNNINNNISEESLQRLIDMGWERETARRALIRAGGNIELATHLLLPPEQ